MKRIALIAAVAASFAAPAVADVDFAFDHFNQSVDSVSDIRTAPSDESRTVVSTSGISPLTEAFAVFNGSADSVADLRGLNGATVVLNTHSDAANDILARLRAESLEDE